MSETVDRSSRPIALRLLTNRDYRLLAVALTATLLSAGAWTVSAAWHVVLLGGGPGDLAVVSGLPFGGIVLAVLVGGAVADSAPQRTVLVAAMLVKTLVATAVTVMSLVGIVEVWQLGVAAAILGLADGFFFPAYSALLPRLVPPGELLAANGIEGILRPVAMMAAGPALAGAAFTGALPSVAFVIVAVADLMSVVALLGLRRVAPSAFATGHHAGGAIREGVRFVVGTRWILTTLLFASAIVLLVQGPIEVLLPFVVLEHLGGEAGGYALLLAAFGTGSAVGAAVTSLLKLPRRYLSALVLIWGAGTLPLLVVAYSSSLWLTATAVAVVGATYAAGAVIWGTLLQRRVPAELLGRVSSLDFFVSLAFLPVSIAIAGPVGELVGVGIPFLAAATLPVILAVVAVAAGRLRQDELENPL
jgi:hypothetical protein